MNNEKATRWTDKQKIHKAKHLRSIIHTWYYQMCIITMIVTSIYFFFIWMSIWVANTPIISDLGTYLLSVVHWRVDTNTTKYI